VSVTSPPELTGRCNRGAVRFRASGPFRPAKACHCRSCRRQSGHFLAATEVARGAFSLSGEASLKWYAATPKAKRGFCQDCGVHLFWERAGSDRISILMGCLDDPTGLTLADHIYVGEKGDYYEINDGLPQVIAR
jgi:hypothetical protein